MGGGVWDLGLWGLWGLRFEIWGLGFRIWGLLFGCGVCGVGRGVKGQGCWVVCKALSCKGQDLGIWVGVKQRFNYAPRVPPHIREREREKGRRQARREGVRERGEKIFLPVHRSVGSNNNACAFISARNQRGHHVFSPMQAV